MPAIRCPRFRILPRVGYSGFESAWLQKAWVNGFRDHTHLFLVAGDTGGLREAIEKTTGEDPIHTTLFCKGGYLGPSTAPDWWEEQSGFRTIVMGNFNKIHEIM